MEKEEEEEEKQEGDSLPPIEAIEDKNKSLEGLSTLTSDVTTKVGSGVQSVKTGVQVPELLACLMVKH